MPFTFNHSQNSRTLTQSAIRQPETDCSGLRDSSSKVASTRLCALKKSLPIWRWKACGIFKGMSSRHPQLVDFTEGDRRYDWLMLRTIVVFGYVGWMAYAAHFVLVTYIPESSRPLPQRKGVGFASVVCWVSFLCLALRFAIERSSPTYYLYAAFPAFFWSRVLSDLGPYRIALQSLFQSASAVRVALAILVATACLEGMVVGYFNRVAWSIGWALIGFVWPQVGIPQEFRRTNGALLMAWRLATGSVLGFTVLPVEKGESLLLV